VIQERKIKLASKCISGSFIFNNFHILSMSSILTVNCIGYMNDLSLSVNIFKVDEICDFLKMPGKYTSKDTHNVTSRCSFWIFALSANLYLTSV
jgi:hypothetical protein